MCYHLRLQTSAAAKCFAKKKKNIESVALCVKDGLMYCKEHLSLWTRLSAVEKLNNFILNIIKCNVNIYIYVVSLSETVTNFPCFYTKQLLWKVMHRDFFFQDISWAAFLFFRNITAASGASCRQIHDGILAYKR